MKLNYAHTMIFLLSLLVLGTHTAFGTKYIPGDPDIGTWDEVTRIYTLTGDVYEKIQIDGDNLTLDGAGHTATSGGYGIYLNGRTGVTVKNLTMDGYIALIDSNNNTIRSNTVSNNSYYGIYLDNAGYNTISDNVIETNRIGIYFVDSNYNTFTGNTISNNSFRGIWGSYSSNNTITENTVDFSGQTGIWLSYSSDNILTDNRLFNNFNDAIRLHQDCSGNILTNNNMMYNSRGIVLSFANDNVVSDNNASENTWTGIFIESSDGNTLTGNTSSKNDVVGIVLSSSNYSNVTNNITNSNGWIGIYLNKASYNTVSENLAESNDYFGCRIIESGNNTLSNNTIDGNNDGVEVWESDNNTLTGNAIRSNNRYGIHVRYSINNTLAGNTIAWNGQYGFYLVTSSSNEIYNNNFIDNAKQVYTLNSTNNFFSLDMPNGGNYWSDYNGQDTNADGLGETAYTFQSGQDDLPWISQDGWLAPGWSWSPAGTDVNVQPVDQTTGEMIVTLSFDNITEGGMTTFVSTTPDENQGPPQGFRFGAPPVIFDISTTAVFEGSVEVCFDYSNMSFGNESTLKLFHSSDGLNWVEVTSYIDKDNKVICGIVESFSFFGVFEAADPALLLEELAKQVTDLNLQEGIDNSLDAKLYAAQQAIDDVKENNNIAAINTLEAFINAVEAQRYNKISSDDAETLIAAAYYIIVVLNEP